MATIEERAKEYILHCSTAPANRVGRLQGYIKGANEQRQIDIDKACALIENVITDFAARYCEVWSEESRKSTFENIRNAMLED